MHLIAAVLAMAIDWSLAGDSIRNVAAPYIAGEVRALQCLPTRDGAFICDGTLVDGGAFQVEGHVDAGDVLNAGTIVYRAEPPSAFFYDIREYV